MYPAEKEVPCCAPGHCLDLTHGSDDLCYNKSKQHSNKIKLNTGKYHDGGMQLSFVHSISYPEITHGFPDHFK
jgi:hypothetical protein